MEPTAQQRLDLQRILDDMLKEIPSFVLIAKSFLNRQKVPIDNIYDFVLGMVYEDFFLKSIDYSLKYVKDHSDTIKDVDVFDLSSIVIDIFETDATTIKELIQIEVSRN